MKQIKGYRINVRGKVQGVGFRFYTQKTARELGVKGYVKNLRDGSVQIEAEAEAEAMDVFLSWVKRGPEWARVDEMNTQEKPPEGFINFEIR